ncbi:ribosomal protein L1 [Moesziomyces antarcticus]|uniref:Related to 50S ribosomal protein L1 n=1 Tax=Pseudozyma antarctica TaxID=84753 RepID=A0A5C3FFQ3_PSEA2|nr:ribosomal protein L1 [Moesziomyces antarcticus]GAK61824.1 ribosomal protein L1 [Moesziomyces antarcticus]SPO42341.1 related to 50S ribosomal protein L1 [Moesziomyces antarcticus]
MSFPTLGSSVGLAARALPLASSSSVRTFSTSVVTLKKSNRARGATRKSPRNQALFAELSTRLSARQGGVSAASAGAKASKKATSNLDAAEGETLLTLEQACEQLKAHGAASRPLNAFEVHIVTSVSSHQTNALRGRIAYPRDPRTKQERLLVFAEEGSEAAEAVKEVMDKEAASSSTSTAEPPIILGGSELISQVLNNRVSGFTKVLCTNTLLPEVSKGLARSLGPKGLMPNPRRGTVVPSDSRKSILDAIRESKGAMDWRSDKVGVIRGAVGRLNFEKDDLRKNVTTLLDAIIQKVPTLGSQQAAQGAGQAKEYTQRDSRSPGELKKAANIIKQVHLSSTQGPGIKLDLRDVLA